MSWGSRRKALITFALVAVLIALGALTLVAVLYEAPSCMDGKQNQDEAGIDCGGSCRYLCAAGLRAPSVRFVRQLPAGDGRVDVIAYLDNANARAAIEAARYTVTLYDDAGDAVSQKEGALDLPPASTVPLFIPRFPADESRIARAFIAFDQDSLKWRAAEPHATTLAVENVRLTADALPRVTATLKNLAPLPRYGVPVVATVFDAENNAIAASATTADVAGNGNASLVFTWNAPFLSDPARTEVLALPEN